MVPLTRAAPVADALPARPIKVQSVALPNSPAYWLMMSDVLCTDPASVTPRMFSNMSLDVDTTSSGRSLNVVSTENDASPLVIHIKFLSKRLHAGVLIGRGVGFSPPNPYLLGTF